MTEKVVKVVWKSVYLHPTIQIVYYAKKKNIRDFAKMEGTAQPPSIGHIMHFEPVPSNIFIV